MSAAYLAAVWAAPEPRGAARLVLVCLADAADHDGVCRTLPVARIAELCALDERYIRRILARLVRQGLLARETRPGRPTVWRISVTPSAAAPTTITSSDPGYRVPRVQSTQGTEYPGYCVPSQGGYTVPPPAGALSVAAESLPSVKLSINTKKYNAARKVYESEIGLLTQTVSDELHQAVDHYGPEWVVDAIRQAARRNARSWAYAAAVLAGWERDGRGAPVDRGQTRRRAGAPRSASPDLTPEQVADLNRRLNGGEP